MRVLQVLPSLEPKFGGPVTSAEAVSLSYDSFADITTIGLADPATEVRAGALPFPYFGPSGRQVFQFSPRLLWWFLVHARDYDLVHIHLNRSLSMLLVTALLRRSHVPFIVQTHGMCTPWKDYKRVLDSMFTKPTLRAARKILVLSEREREELLPFVPRQQTTVVFNALTTSILPDRPEIASPPYRILFCARLHPRKGLSLFVEVCAELARRGLDVQVLIAGPDEGARAEATARARKLSVDAEFLGTLSKQEVASVMQVSHLLLHPAPFEPFGMSMIEAFANRLPVVASASSLLAPMFRSSGAAALPPDGDVGAWADQAQLLLLDPLEARQQAERAAAFATREFHVDGLTSRLKAIVEGVLS